MAQRLYRLINYFFRAEDEGDHVAPKLRLVFHLARTSRHQRQVPAPHLHVVLRPVVHHGLPDPRSGLPAAAELVRLC